MALPWTKVAKIGRRDVEQLYETLLGRPAENAAAINWHLAAANTPDELVQRFVASPEFKSRFRGLIGFPIGEHLLHQSDNVQVETTDEQLAEMLRRTSQTWSELGAAEPHWSVLTDHDFLSESIDGHLPQFYETGEAELRKLDSALCRNGLSYPETALDYGCGVGRLSLALSSRCRRVAGLDVSTYHVAHAVEAAHLRGIENIEFKSISALDDLKAIEPYDLLLSLIVLQHNPPPIIYAILERLLERLRVGGIAYFQVPTFRSGYSFNAARYLDAPRGTDMEMHVLPQRHVYELLRDSCCDLIEVREDTSAYSTDFVSQTFLARKMP